jgi:biotin transport system substrate-specific component
MNTIKNTLATKQLLLTASFTLAFVMGGQINIPFYPVPFTLQTMMLTIAVLYNSKIAFRSTALYVALGAIGLPVFAGWANGIVAFLSPSAGYIFGMLLGTAIISFTKTNKVFNKIVILNASIYILGLIPLTYLYGINTAIHAGLLMFIAPDILKTVAAYAIYRYIK